METLINLIVVIISQFLCYQIITLLTSTLCNVMYQLYLYKARRDKKKKRPVKIHETQKNKK